MSRLVDSPPILPPRLTALLALVWLLACLLLPGAVRAQEAPPVRYERYDSEIVVQPDGSFRVREVQQIRFDDEFRTAFAELPLDFTERVEVLSVSEGGVPLVASFGESPGSYRVEREGDSLYVEWHFAPTAPGEVRTFTLEYEVEGGLWVYDEEQVLEWRAVPADRSGIPVAASRVTVTLPETVPPEDLKLTAYGPAFDARVEDNQIVFEATEPIPDGVPFQVQAAFPPTLTSAQRQGWQRREEAARLDYRFEALDVEMWIHDDGTVTVEEQQQVAVDAGAMREASREIPLAYVDSLYGVQLWEGEQPFQESRTPCDYCYRAEIPHPSTPTDWIRYDPRSGRVQLLEERAGRALVQWSFPALVRGEATTFRLRYTLGGLIAATDAGQRFDWTVVPPAFERLPQTASLRLHPPPGLSADDVLVRGGAVQRAPDGTLLVTPEQGARPPRGWEVSVALPAGATAAPVPAWQRQVEAAEAEAAAARVRRARLQVGTAALGFLLLGGGLLGTGLAWFAWGRDKPLPLVADFLSEPPSDLPPGIVAYLLDEAPTSKGVLASLFHLATLGLLRMELAGTLAVQRNWQEERIEPSETIQGPTGQSVALPGHLATLYNRLAPLIPLEHAAPLTALAAPFQQALPAVYTEMGREAARFFDGQPTQVRHRWLVGGQALVLAALVLSLCVAMPYRAEIGWLALAPTAALALVGLALIVVSRWMPQRTDVGAEEAARWRAFRRYLLNLKQYGTLAEAQQVLDQHFAYAVAMDVERVVLAQAEALGSQPPLWTRPVRVERAQPSARSGPGTAPRPPLHARPLPAPPPAEGPSAPTRPRGVQGWSDSLAASLNQANSSLTSTLSQAAGAAGGATPFEIVGEGTRAVTRGTIGLLEEILEASASGGGGGGFSSGRSSSRRGSWSSSSSRRSSSGRRSSSRRSGGGGRRGFR